MALQCGYARYAGGNCGASSVNPANTECVVIDKCNRNTKNHLRLCNVYDASLQSEINLLLARAGIFKYTDELCSKLTICPSHRDQFGVRWRTNRKSCASPPEWADHVSKQSKGDRGFTLVQSIQLFNETNILVAVGTPICKRCRSKLSSTEKQQGESRAAQEESEEFTLKTPKTKKEKKGSDSDDQLRDTMTNLTLEESLYVLPLDRKNSSSGSSGEMMQSRIQSSLTYKD